MKISATQQLHGWDDGKLYFWNEETGTENCVNDHPELLLALEQKCTDYFRTKNK